MTSSAVESESHNDDASKLSKESSANNFLTWAASLLNTDIQNPPIVSSETSESRFYIGAHSITNFSQDPFLPSLLIPEPLHGHPKLTTAITTTRDVSTTKLLETAAIFPVSAELAKPKMKRKTREVVDVYIYVCLANCFVFAIDSSLSWYLSFDISCEFQHSKQTIRLKYQCPKCILWFENPTYLSQHDDHHHTNHRRVVCSNPRCGEIFFNANDCKRHYTRAHSRPLYYTCTECDASYYHAYTLLQHQQRATHPLSNKTLLGTNNLSSTTVSNSAAGITTPFVSELPISAVIDLGFRNHQHNVEPPAPAVKRRVCVRYRPFLHVSSIINITII